MGRLSFLFIFILTIYNSSCFANYDPCRYLNLKSCGNRYSINKTTGGSQPTSSRSFSAPSALALVKGFGVESVWWDGIDVSLVSGTGKVGAGISTSNSDDTFFGNTAKELTADYEERLTGISEKYDQEKYSFGLGTSIFKSKKKAVSLNLGLISKYVSSSTAFHFGGSASLVIGPLNFGYSMYRDEGIEKDLNAKFERERLVYNVTSYSLGINLPFISFDYTVFDNDLDEENRVEIYSAGFFYYKWMFSYGRRVEISSRQFYDFEQKQFFDRERKWSSFLGIQYRNSNKWVFGVLSNYYMNSELSFIVTGFF